MLMKFSLSRLSFVSLIFILSVGISGLAQSTQLFALNDLPQWFLDSLAREKAVNTSSDFEITELSVKAKVKGKATLNEKGEDYWYYTIDIGTGTPVECYVFTSFDGASNSLSMLIDATLPNIEKLNDKKLASRQNFALDIGETNGVPYVSLDTLYTLGEGNERVSGVLKGLSARTGDSLQICFHNEVGYRAAFYEVFESVISAFSSATSNTAFFENIFVMNINNIPMGYIAESHTIDEDGDVYTRQETSMMIPVDASSVARTDSVVEEFGKTDGSLINKYEFTVENGELANEFSITATEGKWEVDGQVQGKEVKLTLEYDDWLLTSYGGYLANAILLAGEDKTVENYTWLSEADPSSALKMSLTKIEDNKEANIKMTVGPLSINYLAIDNGSLSKMTMSQAGMTILMTPIFTKGSPLID
jgi:hypothetical protein